MLAARYFGPNRLEPCEIESPRPSQDEALVAVEACGLCGSDVGIINGVHPRATPPLTIGHEFYGRILELESAGKNFREGDRVACFPLISCGHCLVCRTGNAHVCRSLRLFGIDVDGGMAEFVKLPLGNLELLPENIPPRAAALIEPLAVAVHGVNRRFVSGGETAVVIGAGPIGLLTALVLRTLGLSNLLVSEIQPARLALARALGFKTVAAGEETRVSVLAHTAGEGADIVFECAGVPASSAVMTSLVRCRGTILNLGVFKTPVPVDLQALNFKEVTLLGSRVYTRQDFRDAVRLAGELPLASIVTDVFSLKEVRAAFDRFSSGDGSCKVLVQPHPSPLASRQPGEAP